jgi:hypothetical protein
VLTKPLRFLMCAAIAAVLGTFGTASQATFYSGDFDPPVITGHFTGHFVLEVLCPDNCVVDLVSLTITSSGTFGPGWFFAGPEEQIASNPSFVGGLHFTSDVIQLSSGDDFVHLGGFGLNADRCTTPSVMFTSANGDDPNHPGFVANLGCFLGTEFITGDTATYVAAAVPEPGSLALLVGGIGAAWLARRRRTAP